MATKAFSDQSLSLHLPLSSHLVLSLPLCEFECFATACRSEAHPACFVSCRSLFFFDVSFPDVSDYFLRGAGRCFFGPANSGLHRRSLTLNRSSVSCVLFCLSVGWFHSVSLSAFLSVSLCFHGDVPCAQISSVQYTTPPPSFPSSVLASLRSRLIAGVALYIQANSWDGRPLLNACVLCLYRIQRLLLHSERWHGYTLWVLQTLLGWTLRFWCTELWLGSIYCSYGILLLWGQRCTYPLYVFQIRSLNLISADTDSRVSFFWKHHQSYYHYYNYYYCSYYCGIICRIVSNHTTCKNTQKSFEFKHITKKSVSYLHLTPVLDPYNPNFISDGRTLKWMPVKNVVWVLFCQHEINLKSSQRQMTACPHHMFSSEGFILMHLPSLPVLWPQIRIIRCIQTPGTLTHTCTHTLARFMFPSLSCLYHSQLAASGQLCSPERHKNSEGKKEKIPLYFD